jgi:hypothetical protein
MLDPSQHTVKEIPPYYEFEAKIMKVFPNDILTQSHMTFGILVQYLRYLLRAPSYQSHVELVLRGHFRPKHHRLLNDEVHAAILCMGGLNAVTKFAEIHDLDKRRVEVDRFYAEASSNAILPRILPFKISGGRRRSWS